ncbi:MAG: Na/Pi symporter [Candidatus Zixiibacteriota bacterium]
MSEKPDSDRRVSFLYRPANLILLKLLAIAALLYLFILSIALLGSAAKLLGSDFAKGLIQTTSNPLAGLAIGVLATSAIQSSSTTTSIIVGLVSGGMLPFEAAVPMVMGANIGTSVTNTIVSLAHISRGDEFRRAFAGSTVHDFFNLCSVIVLLPLQIFFDIIGWTAIQAEHLFAGFGGFKFTSPLAIISKPVAKQIVLLLDNSATLAIILALLMLFVALRYMVKTLKSLVLTRVERFFQRYVFRTSVLGFLLGIFLTVLVQSSSITTSIVIPLIGAGVLHIRQIYPYVLGANIGTTITAFLASFATGSHEAVSVAFAHLIFNSYGTAVFWPFKRIPIGLAAKLAQVTQRSRIIPILYIVVVFFILPAMILFFLN